jgi:hypothetical protein
MHPIRKSDRRHTGNGPDPAVNPARQTGASGDIHPPNADVSGTYLPPIPFLLVRSYIRATSPKPDYGFRPGERALGHKALVFFGRSR